MPHRPTVRLRPGVHGGLARGLPWIYERQVAWDDASAALPPGAVVDVLDSDGTGVATASVQPGVPLALRCWAHQPGVPLDQALFTTRLRRALQAGG